MGYGEYKPEPIFWKSKDGRVFNVDDMDEQHVRNTLKLVLRRLSEAKRKINNKPTIKYSQIELNGDIARMMIEDAQYNEIAEDLGFENIH